MFETIKPWSNFIQLKHTVFSLPFALIIFFLSEVTLNVTNGVKLLVTLVILSCLRASGMTFNRITDVDIDKYNPRTKNRELISGRISVRQAWFFLGIVTFFYLGLSILLSLPVWFIIIYLTIVWGYSVSKRFTWLCHYWIGLSLAGAPIGMWLVFVGPISVNIIIFAAAVFCWVAGFDIIYSLQDVEYDRVYKIKSIPAIFGVRNALIVSRLTHLMVVVLLLAFGYLQHMFLLYYVGVAVFTLGLIYEQSLISEENTSRVNKAFFTINGYISLGFMLIIGLNTILPFI